jgi:hypothetical protein
MVLVLKSAIATVTLFAPRGAWAHPDKWSIGKRDIFFKIRCDKTYARDREIVSGDTFGAENHSRASEVSYSPRGREHLRLSGQSENATIFFKTGCDKMYARDREIVSGDAFRAENRSRESDVGYSPWGSEHLRLSGQSENRRIFFETRCDKMYARDREIVSGDTFGVKNYSRDSEVGYSP